MSQGRSVLSLVALYIGVVVTLVFCTSVGLAFIVKTSAGMSQQSKQEKTLLDLRIDSSREIREALAKQVTRPDPLPPITAKLARALDSRVTVKVAQPKLSKSKEARDAFASFDFQGQSTAMAFDRHALH